MRAGTVTALAAEAAEVARAAGKRFVFMDPTRRRQGLLDGQARGRPGRRDRLAARRSTSRRSPRSAPRCRCSAYAADVERVRLDLEAYRAALGDATVSVVLRPIPPDCETAENLAAKLALARELGLQWAGIYHYGFLRLEALDLVRAAFEQA